MCRNKSAGMEAVLSMDKIISKASRQRSAVVFLLIFCAGVNSLRFLGNWGDFYTVLIGHAWSGQALYSFLTGGRITLTGGGGIEKHTNKYIRFIFGLTSLSLYVSFFFWPWG